MNVGKFIHSTFFLGFWVEIRFIVIDSYTSLNEPRNGIRPKQPRITVTFTTGQYCQFLSRESMHHALVSVAVLHVLVVAGFCRVAVVVVVIFLL